MFRAFLLVGLAIIFSGCASSGTKITQGQIDQIVQGQTTRTELLSIFGPPMSEHHNSDGTQILTWGYAYVGFAGAGTETQGLSVILGQDGKVSGFSRTGTVPPPARIGR